MTSQDNALARIQRWYQINCNGDWEHSFGFSITTLDNPGWHVKIDLAETALENLQFERVTDNGRFDWYTIRTRDQLWEAFCGPANLAQVLQLFLDEIIPNYADPDFYYDVYIPMTDAPTQVWRPAHARMLTEEILEIVTIPELKFEDIKTRSVEEITFGKEDLYAYTTTHTVGDKIKTELEEMFDGVTLVAKEE